MRNIRLNVVTRLARYASIPVVAVSFFLFSKPDFYQRKNKRYSVRDGAAGVRQCWPTCQVHGVISGSRGDSRSVGWEAPCCPLKYSCVTWTQRRPNARLNGRTTQEFRTQQSHGISPPRSSSRQQTFLMSCIIHFAIYKCIPVFRLGKRIKHQCLHAILNTNARDNAKRCINNPIVCLSICIHYKCFCWHFNVNHCKLLCFFFF